MKTYSICNGMVLDENCINDAGAYEPSVKWMQNPIPTVFTPDEDNPESSYYSVSLFNVVYPKREYYLMLAFHRLKVFLLEENESEYDELAAEYREEYHYMGSKLQPEAPYSFFDELLINIQLCGVSLGNDGELCFNFYDFMNNRFIEMTGSVSGFYNSDIHVEYNDEEDDED